MSALSVMKRLAQAGALMLSCFPALAADSGLWIDLDAAQRDPALAQARYRELRLDLHALAAVQPQLRDGARLSLPLPAGGFADFVLRDSGTMAPELAARFPQIVSLSGTDAEGRQARVDISPAGLRAMIFGDDGVAVIEPQTPGSDHYVNYSRRDYIGTREPFVCGVHGGVTSSPSVLKSGSTTAETKTVTGQVLRTYRTAVATTGEYTAFHGGTVAGGLAAVVTSINRVNQVYATDFAARLQLVANNNLVIYTNAATDPYTNNDGPTMLGQNQTNINAVIGSANYDVGHVFSTGGGGVANLNVPCTSSKARGVTGRGSPVGDPFDIDYVAHELGHQFGANHTFNGVADNCGGGNRSSGAAYEPGSGSTIMAYAGICGVHDLQPNSDPYFHAKSIEEIQAAFGNDACETETLQSNAAPQIAALTNRIIPARTPFLLTASATDADNDTLSYDWEQYNLGAAQPVTDANPVDNGARPIIRSFDPTPDPGRSVPRLATLLGAAATKGEVLPTTNWAAMKFRVTVRDHANSVGATNSRDVDLQVVNTGTAFALTGPAAGADWTCGETRSVAWNVAGTAAAPISCANVKLELSDDGGINFDHALAASVPNTGTADVVVPFALTDEARLRASCVGNIFFNINAADFDVVDGGAVVAQDDTPAAAHEDAAPLSFSESLLLANDTHAAAGALFATQGAFGGSVALVGDDAVFTPAADHNGAAGFDYVLRDDCDRGPGRDTIGEVRFTLDPVNDAPTLAIDGDVALASSSSGTGSQPGFAEATSFGPADEASQEVLDYVVTVDADPAGVLVSIDIANDGTLQYTTSGLAGSATVSVRLRDDGGVSNGGVDLSAPATFAFSVPALPDLRATKSNGSTGLLSGSTTVYAIEFANIGSSAATAAVIRDLLPAGLTAATWTCTATGATCPAASGSGSIDTTADLAAGSSLQFEVTASVSAAPGTTLSNTAEIQMAGNQPEETLDNNIATDSDLVAAAIDLRTTMQNGSDGVFAGDATTYTIEFANIGATDADDALLRDLLPAGLTAASWSCSGVVATCPAASGTGSIDVVADLPAGSALTFVLAATVSAAPGTTLVNTAVAQASAAQAELPLANNSATDSDDVSLGADLQVTKDNGVDAIVNGEPTHYRIEFANAGRVDIADVVLRDLLPAGFGSATWTCSGDQALCPAATGTGNIDVVADLAAGASLVFDMTVVVTADVGSMVSNTAQGQLAAGEFEYELSNNSATDEDDVLAAGIFDDGFEP